MSETTAVEVAAREDAEVAPADGDESPSTLIRLALEKGVDVDVLERLVALQERVTERNAEAAMAEALAGFQQDCPPVPRTATADVRKNGTRQYSYDFAPLETIVRTIRPHLQAHGLSYTHDATVQDGQVAVTCTLQHIMGATRSATFTGPIDTSGGKNPVQQVSSARSYGRRYSLVDVLGLVTEKDDDGGAAGGGGVGFIDPEQVKEIEGWLEELEADKRKFCEYMDVDALTEISVSQYPKAVNALRRKEKAAEESDQ